MEILDIGGSRGGLYSFEGTYGDPSLEKCTDT